VKGDDGLDINQLTPRSKIILRAILNQEPLDPITPFRPAVLSNSTIDLIVPALVFATPLPQI